MTTAECNSRDRRMVHNIQSVLGVHEQLRQYAAMVQVTIENGTIVLRGELPTPNLVAELVPAVRRAGVLGRVCNCVQVAG
jgi:hypothetical protein